MGGSQTVASLPPPDEAADPLANAHASETRFNGDMESKGDRMQTGTEPKECAPFKPMGDHGAERTAAAVRTAQSKLAAVQPDVGAERLLRAAANARTQRQRIVWLHRWGAAHFEPLAAVSACQPGCSHCCHLSATITSTEAQLIGHVVRRKPAEPANVSTLQQAVDELDSAQALTSRHMGSPCPFLGADQRCNIYEYRPFVCRTHLSLADDASLCSTEAGPEAVVPRADTRQAVAIFLMADPSARLADIRDFFPN